LINSPHPLRRIQYLPAQSGYLFAQAVALPSPAATRLAADRRRTRGRWKSRSGSGRRCSRSNYERTRF